MTKRPHYKESEVGTLARLSTEAWENQNEPEVVMQRPSVLYFVLCSIPITELAYRRKIYQY